jgi:AraC-like DNA-binding protein
MRTKPVIPTYSLRDRSANGLEILQAHDIYQSEFEAHAAHRDEHYVLLFLQKGSFTAVIDFEEIKAKGPCILCILPGQVHYGITVHRLEGWLVSADVSYFSDTFRSFFLSAADVQKPIPVSDAGSSLLHESVVLLHRVYQPKEAGHFQDHTLRSLMDAYISLFASCYHDRMQATAPPDSRPAIISRQFKALLQQHFKTMKSPAAYASALNISASYLNEAVKQISGFPVSYWIHQEVVLEAKRLLYYTDNTVKEIAHSLGYDDHTYFTRLFSKTAGASPLAFRLRYRE